MTKRINSDELIKRDGPTPDFVVTTSALKAASENGRKVVRGTASSTSIDLGSDKFSKSAIDEMASAFPTMLAFMNHSYSVPDDIFGSFLSATPIWRDNYIDLDVEIEVEENNPRAMQTYDMIAKGRKLGISVGVLVDDYEILDEEKGRNDRRVMEITHVTPLEASIVGIPANRRSWVSDVQKSFKAKGIDPYKKSNDEDNMAKVTKKNTEEVVEEAAEEVIVEASAEESAEEIVEETVVEASADETPVVEVIVEEAPTEEVVVVVEEAPVEAVVVEASAEETEITTKHEDSGLEEKMVRIGFVSLSVNSAWDMLFNIWDAVEQKTSADELINSVAGETEKFNGTFKSLVDISQRMGGITRSNDVDTSEIIEKFASRIESGSIETYLKTKSPELFVDKEEIDNINNTVVELNKKLKENDELVKEYSDSLLLATEIIDSLMSLPLSRKLNSDIIKKEIDKRYKFLDESIQNRLLTTGEK